MSEMNFSIDRVASAYGKKHEKESPEIDLSWRSMETVTAKYLAMTELKYIRNKTCKVILFKNFPQSVHF